MNNIQPEVLLMAKALGWALVHSLWQSLLVCGLLFILLKSLPNASARLKYGLGCVAMGGIFLWFMNTWLMNWSSLTASVHNSQQGTMRVIHIEGAGTAGSSDSYNNLARVLEGWIPMLTLLYAAGLAILVLRLVYGFSVLRGYKKRGIMPASEYWMEKLQYYKERLHISADIKLLFSQHVTVPMVSGFLKPMILIPIATVNQLSAAQLEAILVHEMAHIKRHDYLVNIIQVAIETILFFNPFVWLVSSWIRKEREHCCDDMVLMQTEQPMTYARALAALETSRREAFVIAAAGTKKLLFNRIKRMMEMKTGRSYHPAIPGLLVACLVISLVWLTPVVAQTIKEKAKKSSKSSTSRKENITIIDKNGKKKTYHAMKDVPVADRDKMMTPPVPPTPLGADLIPPVPPIPSLAVTNASTVAAMQAANEALYAANLALKEANKALAAIDWDEVNDDLEDAQDEMRDAKEEMKEEMEKVDWNEIKKEMREANEEAAKARAEGARARKEALHEGAIMREEALREGAEARKEAARARAEGVRAKQEALRATKEAKHYATVYKPMLAKMEQDGLINAKQGYEIEKRGDDLYINGSKQDAAVYKKYSSYLKGNHVRLEHHENKDLVDIDN